MFGPEPKINVPRLLELIQKEHPTYKLDGQDKLRFVKELRDAEARAREVERLLEQVAA